MNSSRFKTDSTVILIAQNFNMTFYQNTATYGTFGPYYNFPFIVLGLFEFFSRFLLELTDPSERNVWDTNYLRKFVCTKKLGLKWVI